MSFPESWRNREKTLPDGERRAQSSKYFSTFTILTLLTHLCSIWTSPMTWTVHMKTVLYMDESAALSISEDFGPICYHCTASSCFLYYFIHFSLLLTKTKNLTAFPNFSYYVSFCHELIERKSFLKGSRWLLICTLKFMVATVTFGSFIIQSNVCSQLDISGVKGDHISIKGWSPKTSKFVYLGSLYCKAETLQ